MGRSTQTPGLGRTLFERFSAGSPASLELPKGGNRHLLGLEPACDRMDPRARPAAPLRDLAFDSNRSLPPEMSSFVFCVEPRNIQGNDSARMIREVPAPTHA